MNVGQLITRLSNTLDGFSEDQIEILDDPYIMQVLGEAVLEVKRQLKRPIAEKTVTITTGERGFNLPSDWYDWQDEVNNMRLDPSGQDSEGSVITIANDYNLIA